jgi:hypothetical protein
LKKRARQIYNLRKATNKESINQNKAPKNLTQRLNRKNQMEKLNKKLTINLMINPKRQRKKQRKINNKK